MLFGWGIMLINDFIGLIDGDIFVFFSFVCKVVCVNGQLIVKLSDNFNKVMGLMDEVVWYKWVFGVGVQEVVEVRVQYIFEIIFEILIVYLLVIFEIKFLSEWSVFVLVVMFLKFRFRVLINC